jgi:hypothetical protein
MVMGMGMGTWVVEEVVCFCGLQLEAASKHAKKMGIRRIWVAEKSRHSASGGGKYDEVREA